jgi:hypothetical protein
VASDREIEGLGSKLVEARAERDALRAQVAALTAERDALKAELEQFREAMWNLVNYADTAPPSFEMLGAGHHKNAYRTGKEMPMTVDEFLKATAYLERCDWCGTRWDLPPRECFNCGAALDAADAGDAHG